MWGKYTSSLSQSYIPGLSVGNCNKLLDSGSVTEHDGDAFCKPCYGKLFGPKGYGFAGGSAGLSANESANGRPQRYGCT